MSSDKRSHDQRLKHIASFTPECKCNSLELFLDNQILEEQQVFLANGSKARIQMSLRQLQVLVSDIQGGVLDHLFAETKAQI
jgi:hypothetical protein